MSARVATLVVALCASVSAQYPIISVNTSYYLGNLTSSNAPGTYRDGGSEASVGNAYWQLFEDTLYWPSGTAGIGPANFTGANTLTKASSNPIISADVVVNYYNSSTAKRPVSQTTWCSATGNTRYHFGSIIPINSTTSIAYYQHLTTTGTANEPDGQFVGSGAVTITYTGSGTPYCTILPGGDFWSTSEPLFGFGGAAVSQVDGYIYLLGQLTNTYPNATQYGYVWAARVAPYFAANINYYQYWNGSAWTSTRLTNPQYLGYAPAIVMQGETYGGILSWSNYYKGFLYFSTYIASITARSAYNITGPWADAKTLFSGPVPFYTSYFYAPSPQPHYDTTGKTLVIDVSYQSELAAIGTIVKFN